MPSLQIKSPFELFTDANGVPLEDGQLYIGTPSLNPEINPVSVFWDYSLTTPAVQPIRTTAGYPSLNGSPRNIYIDATGFASSDYSILVKDKNGALIYSSLTNTAADNAIPIFTSKADALAWIDLYGVNASQLYYISSYDGGAFVGFTGASPGTYTDNGGSYSGTQIIPTGGDGSAALVRDFSGGTDVKWFGGSSSATAAINDTAFQNAVDAIKTTGDFGRSGSPILIVNDGTYQKSVTLNIDGGDIRIKGNGSSIEYTGAGNAIYVGDATYLTNLNLGYYVFGLESINVNCTNAAAKCVLNDGYRKIEFDSAYLTGGAIGIETEGAFNGAYFRNSSCQNQASHGVNLKQRNNNFEFSESSILGAGGNGVYLNTSTAELKGILFSNIDFEGCVGAVNVTGNVGNIEINSCWFESNTSYNVRIDNTAATSNKFGLTISNSQITGSGVDVLIGTDNTGTLINGVSIFANEFVNSDLIVIDGNKVNDLYEYANTYSGTAVKSFPTSGLSTSSGGVQPLFNAAPTEPFGYTATGRQGEIRYGSGRQWIKNAGGWLLVQGQKVNDYTSTIIPMPTGATPSVLDLKSARTNNGGATSVTSFLDGYVTQELIIYGFDGGNTTIVHGTNIRLAGGANFVLGDNDTIHLLCVTATKWVEVSRSNNA